MSDDLPTQIPNYAQELSFDFKVVILIFYTADFNDVIFHALYFIMAFVSVYMLAIYYINVYFYNQSNFNLVKKDQSNDCWIKLTWVIDDKMLNS